MIKRTVVTKMAEQNIDVKVTPDEAMPTATAPVPDAGLKNPQAQPLTNRSIIEAARNPVISTPPVLSGNEVSVKDTGSAAEDAEFMRTATTADLNRIRALKETDILSDALVALDVRLPNFLDIKPKDPIWVFRWVNRKYNGESGGGNRYQEMCSLGFMNVTPDDIDGSYPGEISYQDGGLVYQDVICMKINKARLFGMYKANLLKANRITSPKNLNREVHQQALNSGRQELREQLNNAGVRPGAYQGKLSLFVPDKIPE